MTKSYIVSGCLFGDEGKGTLVDYLSYQYDLKENIRYNGGSHASHTVVVDDKTFKFSQLGSSFLNPNTRTYLSENTVVNLFNIITEAKVMSEIINTSINDILSRIFISIGTSVVTPYHSLLNKVRELSNDKRTGSVGTGVSEVNKIKAITGIDIKVSDLLDGKATDKLVKLFEYTRDYVSKRKNLIEKDKYYKYLDVKELEMLTSENNRYYIARCYENLLRSNLLNFVKDIKEFHVDGNLMFEGSQAVLIDKDYGIKPNTTSLDTTNLYGVKLAKKLGIEYVRFGCISALASRHGMGILPTYDDYLQERIFDPNQNESYFQGVPRYGWFDAVLIRYSLKVSSNDELFMSALDRLSSLDYLKVCNEYLYMGEIDEEFMNTFEFKTFEGKVIITNILKSTDKLKSYLEQCIPRYIELEGFNESIEQITNYDELPKECKRYVDLVEKLIGVNITLVGVGPDRKQKLVRKVKRK